jgi:hypothetical protein
MHRKRPVILPNDWILHHNSVPAHKTFSIKQFLAQKSVIWTGNPSYSSDMASNDFDLFPKINSALMGWRFQDIEDIQKEVTSALEVILQQEFQTFFLTVAASLN